MKFKLSAHAKDVMENRHLKEEWVFRIIKKPSLIIKIKEDEEHVYGSIDEYNSRCLKVVINPLNSVVVTAYFDRKMKKKGCK